MSLNDRYEPRLPRPAVRKYRKPSTAGFVNVGVQLIVKWGRRMYVGSGPRWTQRKITVMTRKLREALEANGYKCAKCPRLLASGARCPDHPRTKPGSNAAWRSWLDDRAPFSEIARKEAA